MKIKTLGKVGLVGLAGMIAYNSATFRMGEDEQAIITRFGDPVRIIAGSDIPGQSDTQRIEKIQRWLKEEGKDIAVGSGAGLYFKMPFIDSVKVIPDTWLELDSAPKETPTKDKKRIVLDTYGRWRIDNPLQYLTTVVTKNGALSRLDDKVYSVTREHVGKNNLVEIVRSTNTPLETTEDRTHDVIKYGREQIMKDITTDSNNEVAEYGVRFADVRIKRADLPASNAQSVYQRMEAERVRIAKGYRSEGEEMAMGIRADADKQKDVILADAYRQAQEIRGEGDALATKIYAQAYSQDPQFFNLWKTLDGYKATFGQESENPAKLVMETGSQFTKYLNGNNVEK